MPKERRLHGTTVHVLLVPTTQQDTSQLVPRENFQVDTRLLEARMDAAILGLVTFCEAVMKFNQSGFPLPERAHLAVLHTANKRSEVKVCASTKGRDT